MGALTKIVDAILSTRLGEKIDDKYLDLSERAKDWNWRRSVHSSLRQSKEVRNWINLRTWLRPVYRLKMVWRNFSSEFKARYRRRRLRALIWKGIEPEYRDLNEHFRPPGHLVQIFEAAGVKVAEFSDDEINVQAIASWEEDGANIWLQRRLKHSGGRSLVNQALFHEEFHLTSNAEPGLCEEATDPQEVLASRFARELYFPLPAAVQAAKTNIEILINADYPVEELLRATGRQAFVVKLPLASSRGRVLIFQAPDSFLRQEYVAAESWDSIMAWAAAGEVRRTLHSASSNPGFLSDPSSSYLNYLTNDGLYYGAPSADSVWDALVGSGLLDDLELGEVPVHYFSVTISDICVDHLTIRGGRYLVVSISAGMWDSARKDYAPFRILFVIEDEGGDLEMSWTTARWRGQSGPVLLPGDSSNHRQPSSFKEWRRSLEGRFFARPSSADVEHRMRVEPLLKMLLDATNRVGEEVRSAAIEARVEEVKNDKVVLNAKYATQLWSDISDALMSRAVEEFDCEHPDNRFDECIVEFGPRAMADVSAMFHTRASNLTEETLETLNKLVDPHREIA